MGTRKDVGIQGIPLRAFGVMDCVLHADEECTPVAIQGRDDLRDRSETRKWSNETRRGAAAAEELAERQESALALRKRILALVNHVDGFLSRLIEGGYRLRIGLEGALRDNEGRKLGGDVHIGRL